MHSEACLRRRFCLSHALRHAASAEGFAISPQHAAFRWACAEEAFVCVRMVHLGEFAQIAFDLFRQDVSGRTCAERPKLVSQSCTLVLSRKWSHEAHLGGSADRHMSQFAQRGGLITQFPPCTILNQVPASLRKSAKMQFVSRVEASPRESPRCKMRTKVERFCADPPGAAPGPALGPGAGTSTRTQNTHKFMRCGDWGLLVEVSVRSLVLFCFSFSVRHGLVSSIPLFECCVWRLACGD